MNKGQRIEITVGKFAGQQGTIVQFVKSRQVFCIELDDEDSSWLDCKAEYLKAI